MRARFEFTSGRECIMLRRILTRIPNDHLTRMPNEVFAPCLGWFLDGHMLSTCGHYSMWDVPFDPEYHLQFSSSSLGGKATEKFF